MFPNFIISIILFISNLLFCHELCFWSPNWECRFTLNICFLKPFQQSQKFPIWLRTKNFSKHLEHDKTLTSKSVNWECWDSLSYTLPQLWSVFDLKEIFQNHFPFHILALVTSSKLWSQQVSCFVWFHLEAFHFLHPKDVILLSFLKLGWKPNIRLWHSSALKKDHYFYQHYGILPIVDSCITSGCPWPLATMKSPDFFKLG
jgi:hypothetical protein